MRRLLGLMPLPSAITRRPSAGTAAALGAATTGWTIAHRTSPVVRAWRPPAGELTRVDGVAVRIAGPTDESRPPVLLLHGLAASSDYFGALVDELVELGHLVVAPDLLGFGRTDGDANFSLAAHLDAVSTVVDSEIGATLDFVVVAHSMGSAVGLAVARAYAGRVKRVVLLGPPAYPTRDASRSGFRVEQPMIRLATTDTTIARRLGAWNRRHPAVMAMIWSAMSPRLPSGISRWASRTSWQGLRQSVRSLVLDVDWSEAFVVATDVVVIRGEDDGIGDAEFIADLPGRHRHVNVRLVPECGHHVAITNRGEVIDAMT